MSQSARSAALVRKTGLAAMLGGGLWMTLSSAAALSNPWRNWPLGPLDDVLFGLRWPDYNRLLAIPLVLLLIGLLGVYGRVAAGAGALAARGVVVASGGFGMLILSNVSRYWTNGGFGSPHQESELGWVLFVLGQLVLACGLILFGAAVEWEGDLPRWTAALPATLGLLVLGALFSLAGPAWVQVTLSVLYGMAWVVLGYVVWASLADLDQIVNRAVVYAALTAALGLSYWGSVVLLQRLLNPLTQGSGLAVACSTLAVASLFGPVRALIQRIIDRHFNRRAFDTARVVAAFGARLREQQDLESLRDELRTTVKAVVQPASVSLWLRPTGSPTTTTREP